MNKGDTVLVPNGFFPNPFGKVVSTAPSTETEHVHATLPDGTVLDVTGPAFEVVTVRSMDGSKTAEFRGSDLSIKTTRQV